MHEDQNVGMDGFTVVAGVREVLHNGTPVTRAAANLISGLCAPSPALNHSPHAHDWQPNGVVTPARFTPEQVLHAASLEQIRSELLQRGHIATTTGHLSYVTATYESVISMLKNIMGRLRAPAPKGRYDEFSGFIEEDESWRRGYAHAMEHLMREFKEIEHDRLETAGWHPMESAPSGHAPWFVQGARVDLWCDSPNGQMRVPDCVWLSHRNDWCVAKKTDKPPYTSFDDRALTLTEQGCTPLYWREIVKPFDKL